LRIVLAVWDASHSWGDVGIRTLFFRFTVGSFTT
jgi:hypothetical protein